MTYLTGQFISGWPSKNLDQFGFGFLKLINQ